MTKEVLSLLLKHPQQLVAEDRGFDRRQISEAGRLGEVGDGSCRLQIGKRLVDRIDEGGIAGEADITPVDADGIIVSGGG